MMSKDYFQKIMSLDQRIRHHIKQLEQLREISVGITAPIRGDRVQTSPTPEAPFTRTVDRIVEMERKIDEEIDAYVDLKEEAHLIINALPSAEEQTIMSLRYLCGMSWEDVSAETGMSLRTIYRWHSRALQDAEPLK